MTKQAEQEHVVATPGVEPASGIGGADPAVYPGVTTAPMSDVDPGAHGGEYREPFDRGAVRRNTGGVTEIDDAARIVYAIQSISAGERRMAAVALAAKLFIEGKIPEMRRCQHCWREGVGQHHEACPMFGAQEIA